MRPATSLGLLLLALPAFSQTSPPLLGARSLALSPDGSQIAFSYQGDVWVAPSTGGRAVPITNHIELDDNPVWSPDGKWIAFSSNRNGSNDVFLAPADGGPTRRLTWWSGSDIPRGWTPDGKEIILTGTRDDPNPGAFAINVETGATRRLFLDSDAVNWPQVLGDGRTLLHTRLGFPWQRPRYEGSAASQLWTFDLKSGKRTEIRNNGYQHLWPQVSNDGKNFLVVTVSEKTPSSASVGRQTPRIVDNPNRTPNVYRVNPEGGARRLTEFVGGSGTRFLTSARNAPVIAFEVEGNVYRMNVDTGRAEKIELTASIDDKTTQEERLVLNGGATAVALNPKMDTVAFAVRGELWTVPVKKARGPNADDATQITDWAGVDDEPLWSPDGKTLFYTSDALGALNLRAFDVETKKSRDLTTFDADVLAISLTPDKKSITFILTGKNGGLYTIPVAGGPAVQVFKRSGNQQFGAGTPYTWSPDGRYVAFADVLPGSGYYFWESGSNIFIFDTQTKKTVNVTRLNTGQTSPAFSADGRFLYFYADRGNPGMYILPLSPDDARPSETELKFEKPKEPVKLDIDFTDIERRARRLFATNGVPVNVRIDPNNGDLLYILEGDLWRASYNGESVNRLTQGGGFDTFELSEDNNQLIAERNGTIVLANLRAPNTPLTTVAFRADWTRDLRRERLAAFQQFWRSYNRSFYDPAFHGRDWEKIRVRYQPMLASVGHRNEMATILGMMTGELEASHAEVSPGPGNPPSVATAHPGFLFDWSYAGPGIKVLSVPDRAPGSYAKTKLNPGDVVTQINGKDVSLSEATWRDVLNGQTGRDLTLKVKAADGKEREVKYRALSGGEFGNIIFQNRLIARRKMVEEKSGGKLTYVHIAGMGGGNFEQFQQQVWDLLPGKQGLIIDVRENGGGNISDRLIDILERRPHSYYVPRDGEPLLAPGQAPAIPMVVMHGESSFSNAEMFPYAMKQRGLATLVGMPTPGYVIWTYGLPLIDGTQGRMPSTGVYRLDGTPLENMGQRPDHMIDLTAEQFLGGQDPQLEKAIEVLLKQIGRRG